LSRKAHQAFAELSAVVRIAPVGSDRPQCAADSWAANSIARAASLADQLVQGRSGGFVYPGNGIDQ
jgi:hypothetical protein